MASLRLLVPALLCALLAAVPAAGARANALDHAAAAALCGPEHPEVVCAAGQGRRSPGGGDKVSHVGWPAVTGIIWKVNDGVGRRQLGGHLNDELLGHHGSDVLAGGRGADILWGDWDPVGNTPRQRDVLRGGPGNDWIYPSHGRTVVRAGTGDDHVWAYYGGGSIDCGPGRDVVRVRLVSGFRLRGCEVVRHFCAFGADGRGGCRKPGETTAGVRP